MTQDRQSPRSAAPTLDDGLIHHRQGRLAEAHAVYQQVLQANPNHAGALHLLGLLALQSAQPSQACNLIQRAIALQPDAPAYSISLGHALAALGRADDAIAAYRRATELKPDVAEAWFALANALRTAGRLADAIPAYQRVLVLEPTHADALDNLGSALHMGGQPQQAVTLYRRTLELQPNRAATLNNLGLALERCGQPDGAIAAYRRALELEPGFGGAANNLGCALAAARRLDEAVEVLRRATTLAPTSPDAWYNLANALHAHAQFDAAMAAYRRALALNPNAVAAHINLGNTLQSLRQYDEAADCYRRALAIRPDDPDALSNLGSALRNLGQMDEAIAAYRQALTIRPDFHVAHCNLGNVLKDTARIDEAIACFRRAIELRPTDAISHSNLVFSLAYQPGTDAQAILAEARRWNAMHAKEELRIASRTTGRNPQFLLHRLKIGYLGSDFRDHCQSLFTIPLLANHDRTQFEIFCYANLPRPDAVTQRIMGCVDHWRPIAAQSDEAAADQVRADAIDILVDLTMHMSNGRPLLMARKPAPIQVAYLAYPGTTGLTAMDYRFTDQYLDPPEAQETKGQKGQQGQQGHAALALQNQQSTINNQQFLPIYSETSVRLPDTFWCYDPLAEPLGTPIPNAPPAQQAGHVTFGCLNNFCKVQEPALALWSAVLSAVPTASLLLLAPPGEHRQQLLARFAGDSIDPARIEFVPYQPRPGYLRTYHRIDIGLDTLPYNGHTTSLDSFWMGVPVVTRVGSTVVGRAGWSQLSNLGLPELAAWNDEQFVTIAANLARDLPRLTHLRATLRGRMEQSPLMDGRRFTRNVEAAYRQMWQRQTTARAPTSKC